MRISVLVVTILSLALGKVRSETLVFSNGRTIDGVVIRTNGSDLMLLTDYGTLNFGRENIKEIKGAQAEATELRSTGRLADFRTAVITLSREKWGADLTPIPATVVEKGMFRNVPYVSFRCSDDYEVNIYGDLKEPAAIEAGVYRKLLNDKAAKLNCINFIRSILGETEDKEMLQQLSRDKDLKVRNGLSFEITPPTDEDAYQGWWISAFSEKKLNNSRASAKELNDISIAKVDVAKSAKGEEAASEWSTEEMKLARSSNSGTISFTSPSGEVVNNAEVVRVVNNAYIVWRQGASGGMVKLADLPEELRSRFGYDASKAAASYVAEDRRKAQLVQERSLAAQAAPTQVQQAQQLPANTRSVGGGYSSYSPSSSGGGRVYVRGYTKKDGTYVRPHTRRR